MSSHFFMSSSLRNRLLIGGLGAALLTFTGFALLDVQQNPGKPVLGSLNPLGRRQMTVEQLLQRGAKGRLSPSVKLQGQVVTRSPLLTGVVYQLQDRTGTIWIQSEDAQIEVGQVLTVQGKPVYEEVVLEGLDFGAFYIQEKQRILANTI